MSTKTETPEKSEGITVSKTNAALIGGGALVYMIFNAGATKLVGHPDDDYGHPAVEQHEKAIQKMHTGLEQLAETLKKLEQDRITRDDRDRQEAERVRKADEDSRRSFWQKERAESEARMLEALRGLGAREPARQDRGGPG